jgi:hypothetical protein
LTTAILEPEAIATLPTNTNSNLNETVAASQIEIDPATGLPFLKNDSSRS